MEDHNQYNLNQGIPNDGWVSSSSVIRTDKDFIVKDFFLVNNTDAIFRKGQIVNRKTINTLITGANLTLTTSDYLVGLTNLSYSPSIGLPLPRIVGSGKTYIIKDETGGAVTTTITIRSDGEKLIDGASTSTITTAYGSRMLYSDGANWFTL